MECPRCKGKLKRLRTVNGKERVIRYNRCMKCGERIKTIELYVIDYESNVSAARIMAIQEKQKAEQLALRLDMASQAFRSLQSALVSVPDPDQEAAAAGPVRRFGFR